MRRSSSDQPTSRDAAQIPPFASAPSSPFAWDEPAAEEEAEGLEPAALQDWYRYIDSLARPARRPQDELDLEDEDEAGPDRFSHHGDTETGEPRFGRAADSGGGRAPGRKAHGETDDEEQSISRETRDESALEEGVEQAEAPRRPPYLSWGEPWTPPAPVPLDDEAAQAIVAQLAPEVPEAPLVDWEPVSAEVPVPDLTEFIPALDVVEPPPRTRQELLATVPAPPPLEPPTAEAPAPTSHFAAPALEAGAPWQPHATVRPEPAAASPSAVSFPSSTPAETAPPVTTTALVRVTTPEEGGSPLSAPGSWREGGLATSRSADQQAKSQGTHFVGGSPAPPLVRGAGAAESGERSELPSIGMIRERLPRHMERLLQVPTTEVAQNSYKSPFKETREALIQRLLDPSLTLEEAARLLGVCPTTVRRYTNRGLLHHYRTPGNQRRFRLSDVLTFLDEHGGTWMLEEGYSGEETEIDD